ncbi:Rab3 GTPase-activating protein catalytic subunit [Smittium culicis]|uniref:Rab3 GTPase-activating protein catalytic subunit n=1 Tax=Smittium culicis TaxID=133412 RepID=A0A1R1X7D2_9FUNG|nr:Rab3 GTPase-activating protein catalytic subunit [Smittium culicis]OMJ14291.1 Rab3 GTPase-activating protein catalytic subunit [Smittium culicis]
MDDENFEIIDYTTASIWESFVSSIEKVLLKWNVDKGNTPHFNSTVDLSTLQLIIDSHDVPLNEKLESSLKWSLAVEEISYGSKKYAIILHRHPSLSPSPSSSSSSSFSTTNSIPFFQHSFPGVYINDKASQTNSLEEIDGITDSSLFAYHPLHRWFGSNLIISIWSYPNSLNDIKLINPSQSDLNLNLRLLLDYDKSEISPDTSHLLQSALNVACQNLSCSLPTFVPTGIGWNYLYGGKKSLLSSISLSHIDPQNSSIISQKNGFARIETAYETVKSLSIPANLTSISGLVKLFHSKFNPNNYPLSYRIDIPTINDTSILTNSNNNLKFFFNFIAAYYFRVKIKYDPLWNCNHNDYFKTTNNLPIGSTNDPLRLLGLVAYFPTSDCHSFLKFDSPRKFLYLKSAVCCKLSAKFIDFNKESPLLFNTLSNLLSNFVKALDGSDTSYFGIVYPDFISKNITSPNIEFSNPNRLGDNSLQKHILETMLYTLNNNSSTTYKYLSSQQPNSNFSNFNNTQNNTSSSSTTPTHEHSISNQKITVLLSPHDITKKSRHGVFFRPNSFCWRLSISILSSCIRNNKSLNSTPNILSYLEACWKIIVNEIFYRFKNNLYLPDFNLSNKHPLENKNSDNIDLNYHIIQQKIDLINFCIHRKIMSSQVDSNSPNPITSNNYLSTTDSLNKRILSFYLTSPNPDLSSSDKTFSPDKSRSITSPVEVDDSFDNIDSFNNLISESNSPSKSSSSFIHDLKKSVSSSYYSRVHEYSQKAGSLSFNKSSSPTSDQNDNRNSKKSDFIDLTSSFSGRNHFSKNSPINIKRPTYRNPKSVTLKTSNVKPTSLTNCDSTVDQSSNISSNKNKIPENFSWSSSNSFESKAASDSSSFDLCSSSFKNNYIAESQIIFKESKQQPYPLAKQSNNNIDIPNIPITPIQSTSIENLKINQLSYTSESTPLDPSSINSANSEFLVVNKNSAQSESFLDCNIEPQSFSDTKSTDGFNSAKNPDVEFLNGDSNITSIHSNTTLKIKNGHTAANSINFDRKDQNTNEIPANDHAGRLSILPDKFILDSNPPAPIWIPKTQLHPLYTDDMLAAKEFKLLELGETQESTNLRAEYQSKELFSDMQSFKAANPTAQLADFVRWHSPRDFINCSNPKCNCNYKISEPISYNDTEFAKSKDESSPNSPIKVIHSDIPGLTQDVMLINDTAIVNSNTEQVSDTFLAFDSKENILEIPQQISIPLPTTTNSLPKNTKQPISTKSDLQNGSINTNSTKTEKAPKTSHLSTRMSTDGNLWNKLWNKAPRLAADQQTPLFDIEGQAKIALEFLKNISTQELFLALFPTIALVLYDSLYKEPITHKLEELASRLYKLGELFYSPQNFVQPASYNDANSKATSTAVPKTSSNMTSMNGNNSGFDNTSNPNDYESTISKSKSLFFSQEKTKSKDLKTLTKSRSIDSVDSYYCDGDVCDGSFSDSRIANESANTQSNDGASNIDTELLAESMYKFEPLYISPNSEILSAIADQVKVVEIYLGRALPGQYEIIDNILRDTETTVTDLKDRKSVFKCLSQYGIGLKKPPVRREYIIKSNFLEMNIGSNCTSIKLDDYHSGENLINLEVPTSQQTNSSGRSNRSLQEQSGDKENSDSGDGTKQAELDKSSRTAQAA